MKFLCFLLLTAALFNVQVSMRSLDSVDFLDDDINLDDSDLNNAQYDEMFDNFGKQFGQLSQLPNMVMGMTSSFGW